MRKGNDYTVYDNDTLTPGYKAKIEHTVYSGSESDLSDLLKLTVGDISALKEKKYRAGTGGIQKSYRRLKGLGSACGKYEKI